MCITKTELEKKVNELRSLKTLKEELENNVKAVESSIIEFLQETEECKVTNKKGDSILQFYGSNYKLTYAEQKRKNIVKEKVKELLSADNYNKVINEISYNVLRVN